MDRAEREALARKRIQNVLRSHGVAMSRILEQKIADAGPTNQRIQPHVLTPSRQQLVRGGRVLVRRRRNIDWYHLPETPLETVNARLDTLGRLHDRTSSAGIGKRIGQTLEIAVYRALSGQSTLEHYGGFRDLDEHDDSTSYSKVDPPEIVSGLSIPGRKTLDFLVVHPQARNAGIEVKNVREWMYPRRDEVRDLLLKCCAIKAVPVLIARRIPYVTVSVLSKAGVIFHETYNQLYPDTAAALAAQVRDKNLLGFHDVRVGSQPDQRLERFVGTTLPRLLPEARDRFDRYYDLLCRYGQREMEWPEFAGRLAGRERGEPEDGPWSDYWIEEDG